MFIHPSPTLCPLTLFKAIRSKEDDYLPNIRQFTFVRGALITALHSIKVHYGFKRYPRVLVPAFVCDTVLFLFEQYNVPYKCYHITEDLIPDWDQLEKEEVDDGDIFLLVYYFGFPMALEEALDFCKRKKLMLIEDCAHSIVSEIADKGIGTHGTAGLFGLRKALPLPHGGFLYMKDVPVCLPEKSPEGNGIYRGISKMVVQWCLQWLNLNYRGNIKTYDKDMLEVFKREYYAFDFLADMSKMARKITNATNIDEIIQKRRENFAILDRSLRKVKGIRVPKTLNLNDKQTVPWIYFFYHEKSIELINGLNQIGINAQYFPTLHPFVFRNRAFQLENDLYDMSVSLPVHQDLKGRQLKFMVHRVKELVSKL